MESKGRTSLFGTWESAGLSRRLSSLSVSWHGARQARRALDTSEQGRDEEHGEAEMDCGANVCELCTSHIGVCGIDQSFRASQRCVQTSENATGRGGGTGGFNAKRANDAR